jgi:hypothetical protein
MGAIDRCWELPTAGDPVWHPRPRPLQPGRRKSRRSIPADNQFSPWASVCLEGPALIGNFREGHVGPAGPGVMGAGAGLVGLPSGPRPGRLPEELGRIDLQDGGQLLDDLQSHVGYGPLDPAQVGPVHLGIKG